MNGFQLLLLPAALLALPPAGAQRVPDSGSLLQQLRPPAPPAAPRDEDALPAAPPLPAPAAGHGATVRVASVRFTGVTVFAPEELQALVQDAAGRELDLAGLEALATRVSRYYRQQGYTVARAYLPPQQVRDGALEIAVVEGRLAAVTVQGDAAPLPLAALSEGAVVTDAALERALLLASEVPGVTVRSTLQPGAAVGTTELVVDVAPGERFAGSVEADNHGSRSTGRNRLGATLLVNNPAGAGDLVALRAIASDDGLGYARAGYQLPVGRNGTRIGLAASAMRYALVDEFASLEAHGTAHTATLFAAHPLLRSRTANANLQLALDAKRLRDDVDAVALATERRARSLTAGFSGDRSDGFGRGGAWAWSLSASYGELDIETPAARAFDDVTAGTAGGYAKVLLALSRQQVLGPGTSLFASYTGQWANHNLDSSEKLPLGGMGAVRAYPQGESPSDRASLLSVELRHFVSPHWQVIAFADAATGRANAEPWPGAITSRRDLYGAGLGLAWAGGPGLNARMYYAHKLGNATATAEPDQDGRVWLQAAWNF